MFFLSVFGKKFTKTKSPKSFLGSRWIMLSCKSGPPEKIETLLFLFPKFKTKTMADIQCYDTECNLEGLAKCPLDGVAKCPLDGVAKCPLEGVAKDSKTFRFTFGPEFIALLSRFAKVHQYDDRKTFKEAWTAWMKDDEVEPLINDEVKQLTNSGFGGDPLDKMYKSARYYYRKKPDTPKEPRERKEYIGFSKTVLHEMDADIEGRIGGKGAPSEAFIAYCEGHKTTIIEELKREKPDMATWTREDVEAMTGRFKKAYKNRFYKQRRSEV
jgi:hypothetical protein